MNKVTTQVCNRIIYLYLGAKEILQLPEIPIQIYSEWKYVLKMFALDCNQEVQIKFSDE